MNRARKAVTGLCVAGAIATGAGLDWFFRQLIPSSPPSQFGYLPDAGPDASTDLASVQKGWPQSLDSAGARMRFITYLDEMEHAVLPPPTVKVSASAPVEPLDLGSLLAQASVQDGEVKARVCKSCHDFSKGGPDRIGPNLWGIVGREIGKEPGYAYSAVLTDTGGAWTYERLFEFLASPRRSYPGTKMSFAGLRDPTDRAAVIRYFSTLGENAPAFPQSASPEPEPTLR